ncbi:PTS glucose/sucrose transporter subunit IIB [Cryobacterium sp. SO2]|nr:PTS glucose/sucrose transporter subunit IIB [Cryobacterium sp. SO2]WEO76854.1 PTS glucose/sucrose transporter subunit IIB [Cryobacterium sp. SO2]
MLGHGAAGENRVVVKLCHHSATFRVGLSATIRLRGNQTTSALWSVLVRSNYFDNEGAAVRLSRVASHGLLGPRDAPSRPFPAPRRHAPHEEKTMASKAEQILAGLGGSANIVDIEACITRLRTEVADPSLVDEGILKAAGAHGVLRSGTIVQVVVGPEADNLADDIEDLR